MVKRLALATPAAARERAPSPAPPTLAVLVALGAVATVAAAWAVEWSGYIPCELCLAERTPYYVGVPLALLVAGAAGRGWRRVTGLGFVVLSLVFLVGAGLGAYHAGVEWSLWPGPTGCSGPLPQATSVTDFMAALKSQRPVRCDAPALTVLGLSLAAWNAVVSLGLAGIAALGAVRAAR